MSLQSPWFIRFVAAPSSIVRVVAFHYAGGSASIYRAWPKRLGRELDFLAVQLPGRGNRFNEPLLHTVDEIVQRLKSAVRPFLDKPCVFFGYSVGALLAYELAAELQNDQLPIPTTLIVAARRAPTLPPCIPPIHHLPRNEFLAALRGFEGSPEEVLNNDEMMNLLLPIARADFQLSEAYTYRPRRRLQSEIVAFGGRDDRWIDAESIAAWRELTDGEFQCRMFDGGHFFLHTEEASVIDAVNTIAANAAFEYSTRERR